MHILILYFKVRNVVCWSWQTARPSLLGYDVC